MCGMKQGSGDLNFGDEDDSDNSPESESSEQREESEPTTAEVATTEAVDNSEEDDAASSSTSTTESGTKSSGSSSRYPYFVRRSNVGDERDNHLELFARDKVVSQKSEFRNQLASELGPITSRRQTPESTHSSRRSTTSKTWLN